MIERNLLSCVRTFAIAALIVLSGCGSGIATSVGDTSPRSVETAEITAVAVTSSLRPPVTTGSTATTGQTTTLPPATTEAPTTSSVPLPPLTRADCVDTPSEGIFLKSPLRSAGSCLHFFASIFQFDSATGSCGFLAMYGESAHSNAVDFSGAVINIEAVDLIGWDDISSSGDVITDSLPSYEKSAKERISPNCELLDPIVQGDLVELWAVNIGNELYTTVGGDTRSYTRFLLVDVEKFGSA